MRIAIIVEKLYRVGGLEEVVRSLALHYAALGHDAEVLLALEASPDGSLPPVGRGVSLHRVKLHPYWSPARWLPTLPGDVVRLASALRRLRADVVHSHLYDWSLLWPLTMACRLAGVPLVHTLHDLSTTQHQSAFRRAMLGRLRVARAVTAISEYTRNAYREVIPELSRAVVVANGVDPEAFATVPPFVRQRPYILCVARLVLRQKAVDTLVRGFARVAERHPEVDLLIVGDGPDRASVEEVVAQTGVTDRVELAGSIRDERLASIFKGALFFAMPSRLEGTPLVFLEAMAASRGVIGSDVGGVSEAITQGENGLLLRRDDPEEVAGALRTLLENPGLCDRMGERGRQRVVEHHAWPTVAARYLEVLRGATA